MTPNLRKGLAIFTLQITAIAWFPRASAQDVCAQPSDREQADCLAHSIDAARQELQTAYQAALTRMLDDDPTDRRKDRQQLVQAQNAWQAYVLANCAYVGGAEGGSNLWVTNFASRCELQAVQERTEFLRNPARLMNTSQSKDPPAAVPQQHVLDLLAGPVPADSSLPRPPASYAEWTGDQKRVVPRQIAGRCNTLWVMMNSGGKLPLLPSAQDPADSAKLATGLCLVGKMPRDWPDRPAAIAAIQSILQRSRQLGEPLSVPSSIAP
jgi:uncharacterized protein YecT (DUF1311 family)